MIVTREELIAGDELTEFREYKADQISRYVVIEGVDGYKMEKDYDYDNDPLTFLYEDLMDYMPDAGRLFRPGDLARNKMWYSAHYGTLVLEEIGVELVLDKCVGAITQVSDKIKTQEFTYAKYDSWFRIDLNDAVLFTSERAGDTYITVGFSGLRKKETFLGEYDLAASSIFVICPKGNNMDSKWIRQTYATIVARLLRDMNLKVLVVHPEN